MTALVAAVSQTKWFTENRRDCQMCAAAASSFGAVSEVILNGSHHYSLVTMLGTTKIIRGERIGPDRREACGDQLIMYLCSCENTFVIFLDSAEKC